MALSSSELETAIGSGSSSPVDLEVTSTAAQQRFSQPLQQALSPVRSDIQRGRTQRRVTPLPQIDHVPETPPSQRPASRNSGRPITPRSPSRARSRSQRTILGELPIANTANQGVRRVDSVRVLKGGFVIKTPSTEQYKYPTPSSQPEPVWRAGDGFSEDEAAPDFLFYITGTRKRRRPLTLPGMGQLPTGMDETENPSIRPSNKRSRGIGVYENIDLLRGGQKEPWPTKTDFEDCTFPTRSKRGLRTHQDDYADVIIPATFRPQREQSVASGSSIKYIPRHKKGPLDFANFRDLETVKSTYPQDDLPSRIQIRRYDSDSEEGEEEGDEMYDEDEDDSEPVVDADSQVDDSCEGYTTSDNSAREPSPSEAYWDEDGNHVFPGDKTYSEYGSDWEDD
ncbi:hypothetical protein PGQ11_007469 [Apiospora arundinis]|uniref:Transcription factor Iwr1 domain-containing protein n=1 Tax=Apiospora arundinis TaxID=335852 RepID=A0ABR2IWA5_9PEZI